MYDIVYGESYSHDVEFKKLFYALNRTEFIFIHPLDENRAIDGVNLRYRFGYEKNYPDELILSAIDTRPCSVLEMMVALALRCEEDIMCVPDLGDRTGTWFWDMVTCLGLGHMNDDNFDKQIVDDRIMIFLNREYKPNGSGGLFCIRGSKEDLRKVEIWNQAMRYLDWVIKVE